MSDCHRGINDNADDFSKNARIFSYALDHYYDSGFTYFELGDGDELWENRNFEDIFQAHSNVFERLQDFYKQGRFYMLWGNHDMDRASEDHIQETLCYYYNQVKVCKEELFKDIKVHESILLYNDAEEIDILLIHGHQVDPPNYQFWWPNKFLVRYLWRGVQQIGFQNPASPSHNVKRLNKVELRLREWIRKNDNQMIIAGHTHQPRFPYPGSVPYFNDGSCTHPRYVTAIEIESNKISLIRWSIEIESDGNLRAKRTVIEGPVDIVEYRLPDTANRRKA